MNTKAEKFKIADIWNALCHHLRNLLLPCYICSATFIAALYRLDMNLHEEYALYVCFGNLVSNHSLLV